MSPNRGATRAGPARALNSQIPIHGIGKPTSGKTKRMSEHQEVMSAAAAFLPRVLQGFDELTKKHGSIVVRFQRAFAERANKPGFPESEGGIGGLTAMLATLLSQWPESVLNLDDASPIEVDTRFKAKIRSAFARVATEYPLSLYLMERHCRKECWMPVDLLAALFGVYAKDKAVIPY
jgi:hypothetical protein